MRSIKASLRSWSPYDVTCWQCPLKAIDMKTCNRLCDALHGGATGLYLRRNHRAYFTHVADQQFGDSQSQKQEQIERTIIPQATTKPQRRFLRRVLLTEHQKRQHYPQQPLKTPGSIVLFSAFSINTPSDMIVLPPSTTVAPPVSVATQTPQQRTAQAPIHQPRTDDSTLRLPGSSNSKESLFIRMTNRIKNLELNMSLSSQYLSELSRKYRTHMDDIQRQYNRTVR